MVNNPKSYIYDAAVSVVGGGEILLFKNYYDASRLLESEIEDEGYSKGFRFRTELFMSGKFGIDQKLVRTCNQDMV